MLAVLDYGGGNLGSLISALRRRGADFRVTGDPAELEAAGGAIFPGDGAFGATMNALRARGLFDAIRKLIEAGTPFLGICVGMQILYESSAESVGVPGLGAFAGCIERFGHAPRVPHMGWNQLEPLAAHPFVRGIGSDAYAYFLHSYRAPVGEETVIAATHGERFSAVVARGNVMGTQFHPEKSRLAGARLLDNFLQIVKEQKAG